ncbi:MAG: hypothetical protein V4691_09580, partial [Pseudomonadota bacterium]
MVDGIKGSSRKNVRISRNEPLQTKKPAAEKPAKNSKPKRKKITKPAQQAPRNSSSSSRQKNVSASAPLKTTTPDDNSLLRPCTLQDGSDNSNFSNSLLSSNSALVSGTKVSSSLGLENGGFKSRQVLRQERRMQEKEQQQVAQRKSEQKNGWNKKKNSSAVKTGSGVLSQLEMPKAELAATFVKNGANKPPSSSDNPDIKPTALPLAQLPLVAETDG